MNINKLKTVTTCSTAELHFYRERASVDRHYFPPFVIDILPAEEVQPVHTMRELCVTGN